MASAVAALPQFIGFKQKDKDLPCYLAEHKERKARVRGHFGDRFLDTFVETTEEHRNADTSKKTQLSEQGFERFSAFLFMKNADPRKFGSLQGTMQTQFSSNNNQHPHALTVAMDALTKHPWDNRKQCAGKSAGKGHDKSDDQDEPNKAQQSSFHQ